MEGIIQDIRFGLRVLRHNLGFSILAVVCLMIGIGANTAVYSWFEGILLRPFPAVEHQDRMMAITGTKDDDKVVAGDTLDISAPDFADYRNNSTLFDWFIVDRITGSTLSIGDRAERATGSIVSANYFDAIGVKPVLGRGFRPEEDFGRNAHPVAVISYQMWKDRFNGAGDIIGRTQLLNGVTHTIVGVAPEGFYGTFVGWAMQFWVPMSMQETFDAGGYKLEDRSAGWIEGFARLKPGVTAAQAQAELSAIAKRLETSYPETNRGRSAKLFPLWKTPFNNAGTLLPTLETALAVVVFILLIVCANVSNLLLAKGLSRRHEMTVRIAIGSGRVRLVRQLLTESLILSGAAAAGGLLLARWGRNLLALLEPSRGGIRMTLPGEIDWRVLLISAGGCLLVTLLFGLVPALQTSRIDIASALKSESRGVVGGRGRAWLRSGLVLVQIALSFVLLVGATLLVKSVMAYQNTTLGFSPNVISTYVDLRSAGYTPERAASFRDALIDRLQTVSGVESAAWARSVPFDYRGNATAKIAVEGYEVRPNEEPAVDYNEVGPDYFGTMGIPVTSGREFTRADNETAQPVAVINEVMAARYWQGRDPVGTRIQMKGKSVRVVGVARTSKYRTLQETPKAFMYIPLRQGAGGVNLQIRTSLGTETMAKALAREVQLLDGNLAPGEVITMREQVDRTLAPERIAVLMLEGFGGLALILACVGLYGVMSYTVSQSTREMALRLALGAKGSDLLALIMWSGVRLTVAAVVIGAAATLGFTNLLGDLLYNVSPRDPMAFAIAFAAIVLASMTSCLIPALRSMRIDPARALKD